GTLSPAGAATYQWLRSDTAGGDYESMSGATADSYALTAADNDKYIKVMATGNGNDSGTVISTYKGPVAAGQIKAIGPVGGTTTVGQTLTAGTLRPFSATVNFQWQKGDTAGGTYENIANANARTYTLTASDEGFFIRVVVF